MGVEANFSIFMDVCFSIFFFFFGEPNKGLFWWVILVSPTPTRKDTDLTPQDSEGGTDLDVPGVLPAEVDANGDQCRSLWKDPLRMSEVS